MITLAQAKQLRHGDILVSSTGKRWRVNGAVQLWKRDPLRIRVPLKHGLYTHDAIVTSDFDGKQMNHHATLEREIST